jgi:hypothetical protein
MFFFSNYYQLDNISLKFLIKLVFLKAGQKTKMTINFFFVKNRKVPHKLKKEFNFFFLLKNYFF